MLNGLFILNNDAYERIYPSEIREQIEAMVNIYAPQQTKTSIVEQMELLEQADVIFSGWGGPKLDEAFMQAAPRLKAVFYGAGSIKGIITDAFWRSNVPITSSYAANAVPVAEFSLSQILYGLKCGWSMARQMKETKGKGFPKQHVPGGFGSTVGIVSLGMIGRLVCELLRPFDVRVIAYDPFVSPETATRLNVELRSLEELFSEADVVSLHTPWLKETEGLITGAHFASMKPWSTFINTSRGAVVNESEMIEVLSRREDIQAVLDVTYPEPPAENSLLWTLPNVVLTPHLAGSTGKECARMGQYVVEELRRYINGEPQKWPITKEQAAIMA